MAIILPHGVLFRGAAEERIRGKLLDNGHNIPVCILVVLEKRKKPDDVL